VEAVLTLLMTVYLLLKIMVNLEWRGSLTLGETSDVLKKKKKQLIAEREPLLGILCSVIHAEI
jgi:hypothetical protein